MSEARDATKHTALTKQQPTKYEKPRFEEKTSMDFPKEIAEKFNAGHFCIQCSGCHGCR